MRGLRALLMLTALLAADPTRASEFHVSPAGDDGSVGSQAQPFRTLERARDAVRAAITEGMAEDVVVLVHGGAYYLEAPFALDERDAGRNGHRVVYRGASGESVRVIGGQRLTGWRAVGDGSFTVDLPAGWRPNQLMENGHPCVMARMPNEGYFAVAATNGAPEDPTLTYAEGDLPERFDATGAQVLLWAGYHEEWDGGKNYNWEASLRPVAEVDLASRTLTLAGRTIRSLHQHNRYYVRGAREFLDASGEFWVDSAAGVLYYRPRKTPIEAQEITGSTTPRVIEIIGSSSTSPAHDIVFEGLTIELSQAPDAFGPSMYLACDGLVYVSRAERVTIRNCRLRASGLAAVALDGESRNHVVSGNLIEDCAYSGVCMRGRWVGAQVDPDEVAAHVNYGHLVTNNAIRRCGRLIGQASGVWLYESGENEVSHNLIEDMPRYGIRIDGTAFDTLMRPKEQGGLGGTLFGKPITFENHLDFLHSRNNRLSCNEIRDCMKDSQDGGAITTYGTGAGNLIAGNLTHHIRSDVTEGSHAGIYLDDASNCFTVEGNIVARITGSKYVYPLIVKGYDNVVRNNILADNEAYSAVYVLQTPHGGLPASEGHAEELTDRLRFSRNILYRNAGLVYTVSPWNETIIGESDYNVIFPADPPVHCALDWKWLAWDAWTGQFGGRYEQHSAYEDPVFVDPDRLDFSLMTDSPALAAGFRPIDQSAIGLRPDFAYAAEIGRPDYEG
ncbi:MAG: right-handed parallel beta-helix repeat-containing protein [Gemmatimonadetes bacterium]|nr:right-handed parallel beta-helix repeat-containing protein [Gemmatimonadota bacterium]